MTRPWHVTTAVSGVWYHRICIELCTADFSLLNRPSINWICHKCDSANCGTFTFQSFSLGASHYYHPLLDHSIGSFNSSSPFSPLKTSSLGGRKGDRTANESSTREAVQSPKLESIQNGPQSPGIHQQARKSRGTKENKSDDTPLLGTPKKRNLCTLNLNCHRLVNKRAEFTALVDYIKPDVIFGTESWLKTNIGASEVFPEEYVPYREDRATLAGGVFILIHKSLTSSAMPELKGTCEMVWAKISIQQREDLLVGCFYMPQRSNTDLMELDRALQKVTGNSKQKQILLAGDFNCPTIDWNAATLSPGAPDHQIQQDLIDLTAAAQLTHIHDEPRSPIPPDPAGPDRPDSSSTAYTDLHMMSPPTPPDPAGPDRPDSSSTAYTHT